MDFDDTDSPKRTPDLRPYREQVAPDPVGRPPGADRASALVRFWAVNALRQRHRAQLLEQDSTPLGHARWLLATRQMLADFERLNLLRQLQLIAPEAAEDCADDLITGGEHVGEPDHDRKFVERLYAMVDLFGIDRDRLTEEIAGETVEVESDPTWPVFTSRDVWKATVRDRWLPWLEAQPIGTVVLANQRAYWTRTSEDFWTSGLNVVSAIVLLKLHDDFVVATDVPPEQRRVAVQEHLERERLAVEAVLAMDTNDYEDCEACSAVDDFCPFHRGQQLGSAQMSEMVQMVLDEPESAWAWMHDVKRRRSEPPTAGTMREVRGFSTHGPGCPRGVPTNECTCLPPAAEVSGG